MGLGILEDKHLAHVPGTAQFTRDPNVLAAELYDGVDISALKHGTGKHADIVLVPQPSDDPNDPLNWPPIKKHLFFFVLTYGTVLAGALGPIVSSAQNDLAVIFNTSVQNISRALGTSLVAALAVSTIFGAACSVKFGKRPVYIISTVLMIVGVLVSSEAKSYGQLLGGRIIQGVGQASLEFLVGSSLADIYFTHERGWPIAIWNIALLNGINITPPISGALFNALGYRWNFRVFAIAAALLLILQIVAMPETTYDRSGYVPRAVAVAEGASSSADGEKATEERIEGGSTVPAKRSYASELALFRGVLDRRQNFFNLMLAPLKMCVSPVVIYGILNYGLAVTLLVIIATGSAQIFATAYGFGAGAIGNTYVSPLVADFIAMLLVGPLTDYTAAWMSRRNHGVFEPEFRLPLVVFYFFFGGMGLFGFGLSISNPSPWGSIIFFGILNFGITIGCAAVVAYTIECHRHTADAALGAVIFGKNVLSAIITSETNNWLALSIRDTFVEMGGMCLFTSLLTIPMYIYGKRARSWLSRRLHFEKDDKTVVN